VQAKDLYNNIVVDTKELFYLDIQDKASKVSTVVQADYEFSLYNAKFSLASASDYSAIVRLR